MDKNLTEGFPELCKNLLLYRRKCGFPVIDWRNLIPHFDEILIKHYPCTEIDHVVLIWNGSHFRSDEDFARRYRSYIECYRHKCEKRELNGFQQVEVEPRSVQRKGLYEEYLAWSSAISSFVDCDMLTKAWRQFYWCLSLIREWWKKCSANMMFIELFTLSQNWCDTSIRCIYKRPPSL